MVRVIDATGGDEVAFVVGSQCSQMREGVSARVDRSAEAHGVSHDRCAGVARAAVSPLGGGREGPLRTRGVEFPRFCGHD